MSKPRKATQRPAGASKAKPAPRQRKNVKRTGEAPAVDSAHSRLMKLSALFDDLVRLYDELPTKGIDDVEGIHDTITSLADDIRRVPGRGMDALRIKAKVARWCYRNAFDVEDGSEEDCTIQWLVGFVKIVESMQDGRAQ